MFILHILSHIVAYSFEAVVFQSVCVCVCVCVFSFFLLLGMENVMLSFGLLLLLPFQSVTPTFGVNSEIFQQS
jgi:glucose dehydrogenase